MPRAFILVLDSFGIGASDDAADFGDTGADTLGSIARVCAEGGADVPGGRSGPLTLPNLCRLGLGLAAQGSTGNLPAGLEHTGPVTGAWGHAVEQSLGKDTPSGHWEMAGVPVPFDWGYFPRTEPCFPEGVVAELLARCDLPGILGNRHGSGTDIIRDLGDEHVRTGKPICYTSADSVFQIAAHEDHFGLQRLYDLCAVAKELLEPHNIARVIARPFVGDSPESYTRTSNRRDLTTPPIADTLLDVLMADGGTVVSVGKIADIFAHRGISRGVKTTDNTDVVDKVLVEAANAPDRSLVFANLVDFDMLYGHRRDVAGYATALETFDARIPEIEAALQPGDVVLLTADHGCDPTWPGSDHTREHVPVLFFGPAVPPGPVGERGSFADMGQTLARHLGTPPLAHGSACFG